MNTTHYTEVVDLQTWGKRDVLKYREEQVREKVEKTQGGDGQSKQAKSFGGEDQDFMSYFKDNEPNVIQSLRSVAENCF